MNIRYLNIVLIICIVTSFSFMCCGCNSTNKKPKITIKYESRLAKMRKTASASRVINLSDGQSVNFNYSVGPSDPNSPNFNMVNVGMP